MSKFVNIRETGKEAFVINAEGVSVVSTTKFENDPGRDNIIIGHEEVGKKLSLGTKDWELDADYVTAQIIKASGVDLYMLPNSNDGRVGRHFVDPEKVQAVEVFEARMLEGETEPLTSMLVDVKGHGRVATTYMNIPAVVAFMDELKGVKPEILTISNDNTDGVSGVRLIDPQEVRAINTFGREVTVTINSGNRIYLNLLSGRDVGAKRKDYLNRLSERVKGDGDKDLYELYGDNQARIFEALQKYEDRLLNKLSTEFGDAVAEKAFGLERIEAAKRPSYVNVDQISEMYSHESGNLSFFFERLAGQQYGQDILVECTSPKAAKGELERLIWVANNNEPTWYEL